MVTGWDFAFTFGFGFLFQPMPFPPKFLGGVRGFGRHFGHLGAVVAVSFQNEKLKPSLPRFSAIS
jgi:hypothetical protein